MTARRKPTLVIRADAGPRIGLGHLMRCLALAEAWGGRGGTVVFVTGAANDQLRRRVDSGGFGLVDVPDRLTAAQDADFTAEILRRYSGSWGVVDGYSFDASYHRALRASGHPLLVVDDMAHLPAYEVDALVNQNAHATLLNYTTLPQTKRLLGLSYVLLRREFRERQRGPRATPEVARKILVTLGGADPRNATRTVLDALLHFPEGEVEGTVVLGPENRHRSTIEPLVRGSGTSVGIASAVDDMGALMAAADLAVVSGGSAVWELAYLGVPTLVLTAGPQEELLARGLSQAGLFRVLGSADEIGPVRLKDEIYRALHDVTWREEQSRKGPQLVDGQGADRVVNALVEPVGAPHA